MKNYILDSKDYTDIQKRFLGELTFIKQKYLLLFSLFGENSNINNQWNNFLWVSNFLGNSLELDIFITLRNLVDSDFNRRISDNNRNISIYTFINEFPEQNRDVSKLTQLENNLRPIKNYINENLAHNSIEKSSQNVKFNDIKRITNLLFEIVNDNLIKNKLGTFVVNDDWDFIPGTADADIKHQVLKFKECILGLQNFIGINKDEVIRKISDMKFNYTIVREDNTYNSPGAGDKNISIELDNNIVTKIFLHY